MRTGQRRLKRLVVEHGVFLQACRRQRGTEVARRSGACAVGTRTWTGGLAYLPTMPSISLLWYATLDWANFRPCAAGGRAGRGGTVGRSGGRAAAAAAAPAGAARAVLAPPTPLL